MASGSKTERFKITHFGPMDTRAVGNPFTGTRGVSQIGKRDKAKLRELEKQKDAQLRRLFKDNE